jgi:glycolate oxidase FAD binding subunit
MPALADGTIARTGGKVVKNVAGYDLHKLIAGGFGTLGVITEVNFRLHPLEEHPRTWTANAPALAQFTAHLRALLDAQIAPSALQLRAGGNSCARDVSLATRPEYAEDYANRLHSLLRELSLEESTGDVWQARQELFVGDTLILKISSLPGDISSTIAELQDWAGKSERKIAIVAQAVGLITVAISVAISVAILELMLEFIRRQQREMRRT